LQRRDSAQTEQAPDFLADVLRMLTEVGERVDDDAAWLDGEKTP
jgi:hypothetical protein